MPTNIGAKMDYKEIISKYLKEKSNEDEVITLLQEHKKVLANSKKNSVLLNDDYFALILKLAKNSTEKIKYHALIILSNIEFCMEAKNFYEMCQIAAENSHHKDGNIRHASFILIKNLNAWMIILPLISKLQNVNKAEVNFFYESFRDLFYKLALSNKPREEKVRKSILNALEIMLPKFQDMVKFWNNQEELDLINKVRNEINMVR